MLATAGGALIAAPFVRTSAQAQGKIVYVNSYGGVWETSWKKAFFDPFTAQTGIQIKTVPGVSFAKLKAQVQTGNYQWDVVNLGDVEYGQAVLENLLEKVDKVAAKADQLPPNVVREYAITSYSLGTNIVYRKDKFPNGGPQSGLLEREEVSRAALPVRPLVHLPRLRAARRRRAEGQALPDGPRPRVPQDGRAQAAHQDMVA
jgi:putative spermidine/putrescine transport system substrate-binding protein